MILRGEKPSLWIIHTLATLNSAFQRKAAQAGFTTLAGHVQAVWTSWKCSKEKSKSTCNTFNVWLQWSSLIGIQLQGLPAHFEELCGQCKTSIPICFPHIPSKVLSSHLLVQLLGFRHLLSKSVSLISPQPRTSHDCGSWLPSRKKVKLFQSQITVQQWCPT